jgi:hypothetical protein
LHDAAADRDVRRSDDGLVVSAATIRHRRSAEKTAQESRAPRLFRRLPDAKAVSP